jgi:hypothetical protein
LNSISDQSNRRPSISEKGIRRNKGSPSEVYVEHSTLTKEVNRSPPWLMSLYGVAYLPGIRQ